MEQRSGAEELSRGAEQRSGAEERSRGAEQKNGAEERSRRTEQRSGAEERSRRIDCFITNININKDERMYGNDMRRTSCDAMR
jgi:hypothetical protein